MSKGALRELFYAPIPQFIKLSKDIPQSERKEIRNFLSERVIILEEI